MGSMKNNSQINILNPPPPPPLPLPLPCQKKKKKDDENIEDANENENENEDENENENKNEIKNIAKNENEKLSNQSEESFMYHKVALPAATTFILEAGEMLYIPKGYWHHVQALTASISLSFWW